MTQCFAGVDDTSKIAPTVVDHSEFHIDLEDFLRGWDTFAAWVILRSDPKCDGHGFKNRLGNVVPVSAIKNLDVKVAAKV
jgi:hypothetical protein